MDPFTAIGVISSTIIVLQVAIRTTQLARITGTFKDPKIDTITVRLYTEQARLEEWKRRMGVNNTSDAKAIARMLPEGPRDQMLFIYESLTIWMSRASNLFKSYGLDITNVPRDKNRFETLAKRVKWSTVGLDQLTELVDSLHYLNDGLDRIAPPPPGYFIDPATGPVHQAITANASTGPGQGGQGSLALTSHLRTTATPLKAGPEGFQIPPSTQEFYPYEPTIKLLYSACVNTLLFLVTKLPTKSEKSVFDKIASQLQLWGSGLFDGAFTIDEMLNLRGRQEMRDFVLGTLADIGVTIGKVATANIATTFLI